MGVRERASVHGGPGRAARRARHALARRLDGIGARWEWVGGHHRAAEQDALRRLALAAATESGWGAVPGLAARGVADLLGVSEALVCRFEAGAARVVARSGPSADGRPDTIPLIPGSPLWLVASAHRPVRVEGTGAAAPVRVNDRVWGAIMAGTTPGGLVPPGAEVRLERFAEVVSVAFSAADARARLAVEATTDPLTGLANHRAFHERLRQEVARARRHDRPLTVVVFDLDHFKHVNDLHGHQEGDRVLSLVGQRLAAAARSGEMMARIGGEEFGWILPETSADGGLAAAERARTAVSRDAAPTGEPLSVSAGVCDLVEGRDADGLVRLADQALYWAKDHGRDLACRYSPQIAPALEAPARAERLARGHALTALAQLARTTDAGRGAAGHSQRVADLARRLALDLGWPPERAARLGQAALLHDLGALGVPPEQADADSERHAALGAAIAAAALSDEQCSWIRHQHERWDGCGVPDGLMGDAIPEGARILAVADAWESAGSAPADTGADGRHWPEAVRALARTVIPGERGSNGSPRPAPRPAA